MHVSMDLSCSSPPIDAFNFVQVHLLNLHVFIKEAPAVLKSSQVPMTCRPGTTVGDAAIKIGSQIPWTAEAMPSF